MLAVFLDLEIKKLVAEHAFTIMPGVQTPFSEAAMFKSLVTNVFFP
jgi:hypothetical protein